uniref:FBD domain-containing protein n=1 Tax=Aegilops tauschii subsp. strangulata TaxID=200361 RepID=A0A453SQF9_AEGTS
NCCYIVLHDLVGSLILTCGVYFPCPYMKLSRTQHPCAKVSEDNPEKTKIVWEPSKDLKHLNLKLFIMFGFEDEDKVTNYIRLVMERAVGLKRIELHGRSPCNGCDAIDLESLRRSQADEASRHRIKEQLRHGSSSSVEIVIC